MMRPLTRILWQVPGADDFLWQDFGPASALFDPRSGDTHLLDLFAREILDIVSERPCSVGTAAQVLAAGLERTSDAELEGWVNEAIAEFDRLGLVFPLADNA